MIDLDFLFIIFHFLFLFCGQLLKYVSGVEPGDFFLAFFLNVVLSDTFLFDLIGLSYSSRAHSLRSWRGRKQKLLICIK